MPTIFLAAPFSLLAADSLAHAEDDEGCTRAPNEQWLSIETENAATKLTEKGLADLKVEIEDGCAEADARRVFRWEPLFGTASSFLHPRLLSRPCSAMRQPGKRKPTNLVGLPRKPNGWIVRTELSSNSLPAACLPTYPLIKMRAYSHQGHGPRADQTGRIHISDFRNPRTISLAKRSRSIHMGD